MITREKLNEYQARYRAKHREQLRKYYKKYYHNIRKFKKIDRKKQNIYQKKSRNKLREKIISILGDRCKICDKKPNMKRNLHFHEIHGKTHIFSVYYIANHINDFLPLCSTCHITLHCYFNHKTQFDKLITILKDTQYKCNINSI